MHHRLLQCTRVAVATSPKVELNQHHAIQKFIRYALDPSLVDELFCQLIRQLTENPHRKNREITWFVFETVARFAGPSSYLAPYLFNWLHQQMQSVAPSSQLPSSAQEPRDQYARKVLKKLTMTMSRGPRLLPPSLSEVYALQGSADIRVEVKYWDLATAFGLSNGRPFAFRPRSISVSVLVH